MVCFGSSRQTSISGGTLCVPTPYRRDQPPSMGYHTCLMAEPKGQREEPWSAGSGSASGSIVAVALQVHTPY